MTAILKRRRRLLIIILSCFLVTAAFAATNGTVQINAASGATYKVTYTGSVIRPNADPPALPSNFRFFSGTAAPDPTAPTGFTPSGSSKPDANTYKYDFEGAGQYVTVLAEDSNHYGWTYQGYTFYGGAYHLDNILLSGTDPKTFELNFALEYQKAVPYAPSSISIQESQVRVGETTETRTTLTITITHNPGASPNIREVRGGTLGTYALQVVRVGDVSPVATIAPGTDITGPSLINQNSGTFTIRGSYLQAGQPYTITAWNRNWWGDGGTASRSWTLLGAGIMGGPLTADYSFSTTPALGINQFSIPVVSSIMFDSTTSIANLQELITAIDTKAGADTVKTVGWWEKTSQVMVGWVKKSGRWEPQNGAPATPNLEVFGSLSRDKVYQMSVARSVAFTLSGNR